MLLWGCGFFGGSLSDEIIVKDFSEALSHEFLFDLKEGTKVHKYEICMSGKVNGQLTLNDNYSLSGEIDECDKGDYYQNVFTIKLEPLGQNVTGDLKIKLTLYY